VVYVHRYYTKQRQHNSYSHVMTVISNASTMGQHRDANQNSNTTDDKRNGIGRIIIDTRDRSTPALILR
jgi:hypothetical protein